MPCSQAATLSGLASIHFWAASSGVAPFSMSRATEFWSSFVQLKFLTRIENGSPESMSLVVASFTRVVSG